MLAKYTFSSLSCFFACMQTSDDFSPFAVISLIFKNSVAVSRIFCMFSLLLAYHVVSSIYAIAVILHFRFRRFIGMSCVCVGRYAIHFVSMVYPQLVFSTSVSRGS